MAIIISQIKTTLDEPKDNAVAKALSLLRLSRAETASAKLYKSSVDARRDICFVNSVYIAMKDPAKERRLAEKHQNVRLYEPGSCRSPGERSGFVGTSMLRASAPRECSVR